MVLVWRSGAGICKLKLIKKGVPSVIAEGTPFYYTRNPSYLTIVKVMVFAVPAVVPA